MYLTIICVDFRVKDAVVCVKFQKAVRCQGMDNEIMPVVVFYASFVFVSKSYEVEAFARNRNVIIAF